MSELLKSGRLKSVKKDVVKFTSSIKSDRKLLKHVISINEAHLLMLMEQGIINIIEGTKILEALEKIKKGLRLKPSIEDVHMAVEEEVIKEVGLEVGGNIHVAKSRNDQVSTAIRMALREELAELMSLIICLQDTIIRKSKKHLDTVIPGYTHLQPAQPVTFAHYILSYNDAFGRDLNRIEENYSRVDLCPMGAGALATTSFPIDRDRVSELLGFSGLLENSIDAVSSRDFLLETLAILAIMAVNVTRFVEDMIIWCSMEFGIIELPDEYSSTSSIMPQKKNPDVLEVIRARMSYLIGDFVASITTMKALPSSYNLDLQEVTPKLWSALETMNGSLRMLTKIIPRLEVNKRVFENPSLSFLTSTELANMLVREYKLSFRIAHKIVGLIVRKLIDEGKTLLDVTPKLICDAAKEAADVQLEVRDEDIRLAVAPLSFIKSHRVKGGPAKDEVERMIKEREKFLKVSKESILKKKMKLKKADDGLNSEVKSYLERTRNLP